jgi:hypothetical protein
LEATVAEVSVIIALLSFVVSAVALFFAQFRPPRISAVIGPTIEIYYPADGGFGVYIPTTFVNTSPRAGTVQRCGITLFHKSRPDEQFFMAWRFFMRLNPKLSYDFEAVAHALAVLGTSSITEQVWLTWRYFSVPELVITEGDYVLVFHYWVGAEEKPRSDLHEFHIDPDTHAQLDDCRASKKESTFVLLLDNKIDGNKLMTSEQSRSVLGG